MRSPFRVALAVVSCAILLFIGATSADVPAISLKAPTVAPDAGHSVVGVVLSPDMRARLRRQGGSLTVQWASSLGRGCLTRAADDGRMDATFDLKGLDPGTVTMIASLTTGGQTIDSTPVTTGLFSVDVQPANATVVQGQTFVETISTSPDTAALVQVTWQVASSVDGAVLSSGVVPVSAFGPDGQGRLVATQTFLAPSAFTGIAILTISAAASSLDAFGTPTTATASSAVTLTIQPSTSMPLALAFTTASGQGFPAGATADLEFTLQTQDPSTTQASFTVFDTQKSVVAHGPATLTQTGATSASGVASWAVPAGAGGQYTVTVLATLGSQSVTASLAINVVPAAGPALAIAPSGPITVTAGQAATVGFTLTGVASLAGATLTAVFTDRTTGAILSSAAIDPATLVQQPGGFAGSFAFAFPVTSVTLDTTLTITYLENGAPVASGAIGVLVQPALAQIVVSIGNAPPQAAAGTSPPLTIVISGVTVQLMSSVSWSLKDGLGSTVATANISLSQLVLVGTHYETTVPMTLSPSIAPGTYTLEAAMTTTAGATFTASQPIAITAAVSVRFVQAASTIDEGTEQSFQALLRPRVEVGFAKWLFTNGVGVAAPGFPSGTVAAANLVAVTDGDGTPAWLIGVTFTVPSGTVTVQTLVHFELSVFDPAGRPLATAATTVLIVPQTVVRLTSVDPEEAFPGMRVTLAGFGFSPSAAQDRVVIELPMGSSSLTPDSAAGDGSSVSFVLPFDSPVGTGTIQVEERGAATRTLPFTVLGSSEVATLLEAKLEVRTAYKDLTEEGRRRIHRAWRFYHDEVLVRLVAGDVRGNFREVTASLDNVLRRLADADAAGVPTTDLVALVTAWRATLARLPEVRRVEFTPSTREILRTGDSRTFQALLFGERRSPISLFPRSELKLTVKCRAPFVTRVTGNVTFASADSAVGPSPSVEARFSGTPAATIPFTIEQRQRPPIPRPHPISATCYTFIESVEDPDKWLPEGNQDQAKHGNTHRFHFAGWAKLHAQAGRCQASPPRRIPRDTDFDDLPDAIEVMWEALGFNKLSAKDFVRDNAVPEAHTDVDDKPKSEGEEPGILGDGVTAWEEYRGFFVGAQQQRTSPLTKDLYVRSEIKVAGGGGPAGVGWLVNFPDLQVQPIDQGEMDQDRQINFNNLGHFGATPQHALHLAVRSPERPCNRRRGDHGRRWSPPGTDDIRPRQRGDRSRRGRPRRVCIEGGPNGEPESTQGGDDEPLFPGGKNVGGVLGTPNEVYLIEIFRGPINAPGSIEEVMKRLADGKGLQARTNSMIKAVIAHECGHGIRIKHYVQRQRQSYTVMTDTFFVTVNAPTQWDEADTVQNRLHLKSR